MALLPTSASLTPALTTSIQTEIASTHTLIDVIKHVITPTQQKRIARVAARKEAEITAILTKLMATHAETLPPGMTLLLFNALTQEVTDSKTLQELFLGLAAIAGANADVVQNNRYYYALQGLNIGRQLGKTNTVIDDIVKEISTEFFAKPASKKVSTAYNIATGSSMVIINVKPKKMFTNTGKTVLTFLKVNGLSTDTITVHPATAIEMLPRWTKIEVSNESTITEGSFSLYLQ